MSYSHGTKFTQEDYKIMKDVIDAAEWAIVLTNDYYSWQKECEATSKLEAGRIINWIAFLVRRESLSPESAKEAVKDLILKYEDLYVLARTRLYQEYPSLPFHLRKCAEVSGVVIGGSHFWSANCPRYNSWKTKSKHGEDAMPEGIRPKENGCSADANGTTPRPTKRQKVQGPEATIKPVAKTVNQTRDTQIKENSLTSGNAAHKKVNLVREDITNGGLSHLSLTAVLAPCDYIKSLPSRGVQSTLIDVLNV